MEQPLIKLHHPDTLCADSSKMVSNHRKVVGAPDSTFSTAVVSLFECLRLFGSLAESHCVNGAMKRIIIDQPTSGRALTYLEVEWLILDDQNSRTEAAQLIHNCISSNAPSRDISSTNQLKRTNYKLHIEGELTRYAMEHRCKNCTKKTTHYCSGCDDVENNRVFLWLQSSRRTCFSSHLNSVHTE